MHSTVLDGFSGEKRDDRDHCAKEFTHVTRSDVNTYTLLEK